MRRASTPLRSHSTILAAFVAAFVLFGAWLPGPMRAEQPAPYRILVTNDDGVRAPGLLAVAQALQSLGEITIVAPDENQSAKSQALSVTDPIYVDPTDLPGGLKAVGLAATPATCVKVALGALMTTSRPNLVVSGINRGYNLGMTTYISGTVGAAREAALEDVPAIAFSLAAAGHPSYGAAAEYARRLVEIVKANGLSRGVLLNVNVPAGPLEAIKGWRLATQSAQMGVEGYVERETPQGRRYFWSTYRDPSGDVEGSDVWTVEHGYVSITPLRVGEFDAPTADALKALIK